MFQSYSRKYELCSKYFHLLPRAENVKIRSVNILTCTTMKELWSLFHPKKYIIFGIAYRKWKKNVNDRSRNDDIIQGLTAEKECSKKPAPMSQISFSFTTIPNIGSWNAAECKWKTVAPWQCNSQREAMHSNEMACMCTSAWQLKW